ncbi:MAG: serine hydrolase domain-containing protein [Acidimicrobiia bacterium]
MQRNEAGGRGRGRRRQRLRWVSCAVAIALAGCSASTAADGVSTGSIERASTSAPATSSTRAAIAAPPTTAATSPTTTAIAAPPTTAAPTTTSAGGAAPSLPLPPPTVTPSDQIGDPSLSFLRTTFDTLAGGNAASSVTVLRDGAPIFAAAAGQRIDGAPVTTDTPFVVASVSKLVTALTIARLAEAGLVEIDGPLPWTEMGIAHDPAWADVTVRELLDHTSGMPIARTTWLDEPGPCSIPLIGVMALPPEPTRGTWRYSNGNYCALGLLIEHLTGSQLDAAARVTVFDPIAVSGPHLTTDGAAPDDAPYFKDVARFDRLGGAGTWMASTDDVAAMLAAVSAADMDTLVWPGIMADQYGWGHTGTVDGAKACAWVMDGGRTVVVGVVAGNQPSTGGRLCDSLVSALAVDLGEWAGEPFRTPI